MPRINRIGRNTIFVLIARASELIAGMVTIALVARYLGVEVFGRYAFVMAVAFVLLPLVMWGSARILIREISIDKEKAAAFLSSGLILNGLMAIVSMIIITLILFIFRPAEKTIIFALYLAAISQVMLVMTRTFVNVFIAYEKMGYDTLITVLSRSLILGFLLLVIHYDLGFKAIFIAMVVGNGISLFLVFWLLASQGVKPGRKTQYLTYLFRESSPIAISSLLAQGYMYVNVFILKVLRDAAQISLYQAPQRIIAPLLMLPGSFLLAFAPALSRMANVDSSYSNLKSAYQKTLKFTFILSLPISILGMVFAKKFILLFFGKEFLGATTSFQILIWIAIPLFANLLLNFILTSMKRQNVLMVSNGLCFLVTCLIGLFLVPKYGNVGASWAVLLGSVTLFMANFYFVSKYLEPVSIMRFILKPVK